MSIQQSGYYPALATPNEANVVSFGSSVPRNLSNRFADMTNVLDFGADPTGATDSHLAIQRAIAHAGGHPIHGQDVMNKFLPANTETTLASGTPYTFDFGSKTFPQLFYVDSCIHTVYFPAGIYRISRPIVIGPYTKLLGEFSARGSIIAPMIGEKGKFNCIESWFVWLNRTQCENNVPWQLSGGFDNGISIKNLFIINSHGDPYAVPPVRQNKTAWYRMPLMLGTPSPTFPATANATSGDSFFTATGSGHHYWVGAKIKFTNHATEYTYVSRSGNQIFVSPNISTNVSGANVLIGLPANNGIMVNGGEFAEINQNTINNFEGCGIAVMKGTPAPVISNVMVNGCDIAFWADGGNNVLIQPSGDSNNVWLRSGYLQGGTNTTMIGAKVEGKHGPSVIAGGPYTVNDARSGIELGNYGNVTSNFTFIGGGWNYHAANAYFGQSNAGDYPFIHAFRESFFPQIQVYNMRQGAYRNTFYRQVYLYDPSGSVFGFDRELKRSDEYDWENAQINCNTNLDYTDDTNWSNAAGTKIGFRISSPNTGLSQFALYGDQGSGILDGVSEFTRSTTTATFLTFESNGTTPRNHNLQVGDQVKFRYPAEVTALNGDGNSANVNPYGAFIVKSVPTGNSFTITVANSGGSSGSGVIVQTKKTFQFHGFSFGEHIVQLASDLPINANRRAFTLKDKQGRDLSGLRVATAQEGDWWASKSLNMGGTIDTPASRILHGTGDPQTAAISAPNGSLYLRTNGTADTTIYVRAGGSWTAIAST